MVKTIIKDSDKFDNRKVEGVSIRVAEMFSNTVQGEGINTGVPATFLRLNGCTLSCKWCDTLEVWKGGSNYSITEILNLMEENGVDKDLRNGHHLIITGGSPLMQQDKVLHLIIEFVKRFGFKPYIEIENEAVLKPTLQLINNVDCWNNSPKLSNSGNKTILRYREEVLLQLRDLKNSWFKFVITCEEDWNEIKEQYIDKGLIRKSQIILMPEGVTKEEISKKYNWLIDLACREGVRVSDRFHVTVWNKKTGV